MKKKARSRSTGGVILKATGYVLFLALALGIGTLAGWVNKSKLLLDIAKNIVTFKDPKKTFDANSVTLLVLGCDEDLATGGKKVLKKQARSDMMLIAKLDFVNNTVTGVSIPRDTRCKLPGYQTNKINAYHNFAKKGHEAELTQKAVEFLLPGVHIDRVVTLDFDHFQELVDLVGGVPLTVDKRLDYVDKAGNLYIHIKAGYQNLNGYNAMCYVRFRHADSDLVRQERQKKFLLAFKQQALKDWMKVPDIVNEGQKVLGDALSTEEISSLALFARSVPPQNIQWGQVPVKDIPGSTDLALDEGKVYSVLSQYGLVNAHDGAVSGGRQ